MTQEQYAAGLVAGSQAAGGEYVTVKRVHLLKALGAIPAEPEPAPQPAEPEPAPQPAEPAPATEGTDAPVS